MNTIIVQLQCFVMLIPYKNHQLFPKSETLGSMLVDM